MKKNSIHLLVTFILSLIYSYVICMGNSLAQNVASALYVVYLFVVLATWTWEVVTEGNLRDLKMRVLLLIPATHLGILIGFLIGGGAENLLWVVDSYEIHVPGSVNVANFLQGSEALRTTSSPIDRLYLTHWIIGILFSILGAGPFVSGLGLMLVTLLSTWVLYEMAKKIMDEKMATIASLIYATAPTVLFYTLAYYKEAVIQMLVLCFCYSYVCFTRKQSFLALLGCLVSMFALLSERFYLAPFLASILFIFILFSRSVRLYAKILVIVMGALMVGIIYKKYHNYYFDFDAIFESLKLARGAYNNYSDVNPSYNSELFYPLAFLKIYLTPIFTPNKLSLFHGYSTLLTWGSFFHQLIAGSMVIGLLIKCFKLKFTDYLLLLPFLLFLALFAYIAPYNGRLRDSFYPIIALFTAPTLSFFVSSLRKKISHSSND
ncbi:MAG TPA: glycosyltransferase family 39 protein [Bacteriovoracaceae bacterium]|nr:glycosyltransferase family 39 protein [Bacteriovoracaceae bacterium]